MFELCSSKMPLPSTNLNLTRKSSVAKPKDENLGLEVSGYKRSCESWI